MKEREEQKKTKKIKTRQGHERGREEQNESSDWRIYYSVWNGSLNQVKKKTNEREEKNNTKKI